MKACRMACADEFLLQMKDGLSSQVEQGGVNLSGGQKQRLCIARALLKRPRILILDDSTSAVDTATEAKIREALQNNLADTTKIIIAQRITSVMHADQILIMEDGKLNDCGTHEELLQRNEIYQEIITLSRKDVTVMARTMNYEKTKRHKETLKRLLGYLGVHKIAVAIVAIPCYCQQCGEHSWDISFKAGCQSLYSSGGCGRTCENAFLYGSDVCGRSTCNLWLWTDYGAYGTAGGK